MTLVETKKFLALMGLFYQNWKPTADLELVADAWYMDLKDYSVDDINAAFQLYRAQGNQFPPAQPGVLINILVEARTDSLPEMEAWSMVAKAVKNGIYGAEKEFDALPEAVKKAVGSPGQLRDWAMSRSEDVATVGQSNFLRAYRTVIKRQKDDARGRINGRMQVQRLQG